MCSSDLKQIVCPDGCFIFRLTAEKLGGENFFKDKFFDGDAGTD